MKFVELCQRYRTVNLEWMNVGFDVVYTYKILCIHIVVDRCECSVSCVCIAVMNHNISAVLLDGLSANNVPCVTGCLE